MGKRHHNPERRAWKGRSYRKGGERVKELRRRALVLSETRRRNEVD